MWEVKCPECGKILDGLTYDYGVKWECPECHEDKTDVLHCERGCKVMANNLDICECWKLVI